MRKYILILIVTIIFIDINCINEKYSSEYFYLNKDEWEKVKDLDFQYDNYVEMLKIADTYYENICNQINIKNKYKKISIYINENNASLKIKDLQNPYLILNKSALKRKIDNYLLLEIIDFLVKGRNYSLEYGLSNFLIAQIKSNKKSILENRKSDFMFTKIFNNLLYKDKKILNYLGSDIQPKPEYNGDSNINILMIYHELNNNFIKYLLNLKDINTFINLLEENGTIEAYIKYYNKSLEEIKEDWIEYIKNLPD